MRFPDRLECVGEVICDPGLGERHLGSCVLVSPGLVLTCAHVLKPRELEPELPAERVFVRLAGATHKSGGWQLDVRHDVATIRLGEAVEVSAAPGEVPPKPISLARPYSSRMLIPAELRAYGDSWKTSGEGASGAVRDAWVVDQVDGRATRLEGKGHRPSGTSGGPLVVMAAGRPILLGLTVKGGDTTHAYFVTPTRIEELLLGVPVSWRELEPPAERHRWLRERAMALLENDESREYRAELCRYLGATTKSMTPADVLEALRQLGPEEAVRKITLPGKSSYAELKFELATVILPHVFRTGPGALAVGDGIAVELWAASTDGGPVLLTQRDESVVAHPRVPTLPRAMMRPDEYRQKTAETFLRLFADPRLTHQYKDDPVTFMRDEIEARKREHRDRVEAGDIVAPLRHYYIAIRTEAEMDELVRLFETLDLVVYPLLEVDDASHRRTAAAIMKLYFAAQGAHSS